MNRVFASLPDTIFDVMSGLARETGAINLGQGFPEWDGPADIRERAARAVIDGPNQYPPMRGTLALREAVADHYGRMQGIALDWRTEVTVTSGAPAQPPALSASVRPTGASIRPHSPPPSRRRPEPSSLIRRSTPPPASCLPKTSR